jgi:1-phosphofructokinase family hexose kinase
MRPVLVVSLNPAVDAEWRVARIQWEEKNVIASERSWAGGKGVNVARWLNHLGQPARLLIPLGGESGKNFARQLRAAALSFHRVLIRESTRTNVFVTQNRGAQLRFNPKGPVLSAPEWRRVFAGLEQELKRSRVVILSGSLPRDAAAGTYARMLRLGHKEKRIMLLDCDGPALREGIRARPFLVKPNEFELAQWIGARAETRAQVVRAASRMSAATGGWVLVSRGAKGGLLLHQASRCGWVAEVPRLRVRNCVGAGDALLAAAAQSMGDDSSPVEWLRSGLAAGCAATQCTAGELPALSAVDRMRARIRIRELKAGQFES